MKKYIRFFACLLLFICFSCLDVYASTNTYDRTEENNYLVTGSDITITDSMLSDILSTPAVKASEKVYDFADLYSDSEEEKLYSEIVKFIDDYNLDLAVVTIDSNTKSSTQAYAQDFYDYNDFGIGSSYDGVLFLIDMQNREYYMTTSGSGIVMYTDARINSCLDAAYNGIVSGDYYDGTISFIDTMSDYAAIGAPDEFGNEPKLTGVSKLKVMPWTTITIFSIVATAFVMYILISNSKLARQANSSRHYLTKADVSVADEIFLGSNVHRSARHHESSHGGGSSGGSGRSISSGSSGRSHGGGGRRF